MTQYSIRAKLDINSNNFTVQKVNIHDIDNLADFEDIQDDLFDIVVPGQVLVDTVSMIALHGVEQYLRQLQKIKGVDISKYKNSTQAITQRIVWISDDVPQSREEIIEDILNKRICAGNTKDTSLCFELDLHNLREQITNIDIPHHDCVTFFEFKKPVKNRD